MSLCFSPDGRNIIAQGAAPDWNVAVWQWEKLKCVAVIPARAPSQPVAPVREIKWNPQEPGSASLVGQGSFRIFKMTENSIRPQPSALGKKDAVGFTAHAWLPEEAPEGAASGAAGDDRMEDAGVSANANKDGSKDAAGNNDPGADASAEQKTQICVVGDDTGELLVIEDGEFRTSLPSPGPGSGIDCIIAHGTKGFICAGEGGKVHMYEKTDDKEMFRRVKTFAVPIDGEEGFGGSSSAPSRVRSITLSPSEEMLVCALENNQMYVVDLADCDILKEEEMVFELLSNPFHSKAVTGIDACVKKPLVATCSADKTVRVWNYLDMTLELEKTFVEEAFSVSLHPSGLHVLVGFADKLRLCNLLVNDVRAYKEFAVKACRECRFSNGGQLFAAVNGSVVQVYDAYTAENVGNFRGHGGRVKSVFWNADDTKIVSCGVDGAVYEWTPKEFQRQKEHVKKGTEYGCVVGSSDGENAYAVGADAVTKTNALREFDDTHQLVREMDTGVLLTQLAMPKSSKSGAMFAAASDGSVRAYRYPLTGEFQSLACHSGAVTKMALSHDDGALFVASEDGCVSVFDVRDKDGASARRAGKEHFSEEVLVTKADMEETLAKTHALEMQVSELTLQNEREMRAKDADMNAKIKDLTERFQAELDGDKSRYEALSQTKNEQELKFEEELKASADSAAESAKATEEAYQKKMLAEVERYQALAAEKDSLNEKWDEQNTLLVERQERVIEELTEEFSAKLREEVRLREKMKRNLDLGTKESDEIVRQMEEDADLEIQELKERYELRLAEERDVGLRLKGENGIMKKKFNQLQKDIHEQKDVISALGDDKRALRNTIAELEKDVAGLRKELRDRDDTIGDKEKRIYDLKKKTQELEKFKFVLDYKIKELKKEIEPREQDVADMKHTIQSMDHELERYHKSNAHLDLTIQDLKHKLAGLQKDVVKQRATLSDKNQKIRGFQADLHATSRLVQYPKKLVASVNELYQKHVTATDVADKSLDEDVQKEFARQRVFLEKTIENLKRKLKKDTDAHRADVARVLGENVALLKEVNELRREAKQARQREKAVASAAFAVGGSGVVATGAGGGDAAARSATGTATLSSARDTPRGGAGASAPAPTDTGLSVDAAREIESLRVELAEARLEVQIRDARVRALEAGAGLAGGVGGFGSEAPEAVDDPELTAAALKIQASARGRLARKEVTRLREAEEETRAAIKIQAAHRGKAARKEVEAMRQEQEAEEPPPLDKEDSLGAI